MSQHEMLSLIEEGVENGRIKPHLASYIVAEMRRDHTRTARRDQKAQRAHSINQRQRQREELARN